MIKIIHYSGHVSNVWLCETFQVTPSNIKDVHLPPPIKQIKLCSATLCAISKQFTKDASPKPAFQMVFPYVERIFAINKQINKFWCAETYKDYPWLKGMQHFFLKFVYLNFKKKVGRKHALFP